ncbi:MAG TPA: hypothetical protein VF163_15030 [Micromonosporaceae bacterium]
MQIRLCDTDRERFNVDEWLEFDPLDISVADLDELGARFGFDPFDDDDPWPVPFYGSLTLEQAGNPDAKPKPPKWQRRAVAWMVLRQAGCDVSWEESGKVRIMRMQLRESPGKEPTRSDPSTTTPSESS